MSKSYRSFRWYLGGPMTGYPKFNFVSFHAHAALLRHENVTVVNPAELNTDPDTNEAVTDPYEVCLRRALQGLLTCDGLVLLPGWEASKGARLEVQIAEALNMPYMEIKALLDVLRA